jgi:hypothetical protein
VATRESDAAAGVEVMALPLTVASSRVGHLQQSLGASAQRQGRPGGRMANGGNR